MTGRAVHSSLPSTRGPSLPDQQPHASCCRVQQRLAGAWLVKRSGAQVGLCREGALLLVHSQLLSAARSEPGGMPALWLVLAISLLGCLQGAQGHGYLQVPAARNWLVSGQRRNGPSPQGFYGPMNLNRPGKPLRGTTCGGEYNGDSRFEAGGRFATRRIAATYRAGALIKTRVHISINHWGYFELRLCPLRGTSTAAERATLSEGCFAKYPLKVKVAGGKYSTKYWMYRRGEPFDIVSTWRLPRVRCQRCVLQWRYMTAHMCYPPGINKAKMRSLLPGGRRNCPRNIGSVTARPPEKFWNCADIRLV